MHLEATRAEAALRGTLSPSTVACLPGKTAPEVKEAD
jgi:hypothetical protein